MRAASRNAASIAGLLLTTEALVVEKKRDFIAARVALPPQCLSRIHLT